MSGGRFDYTQYRLEDITEEIEQILSNQGNLDDYGDEYETYPLEIQEKFKEGIAAIKKAAIYIQRIDWYLSGDDGEESFLKTIKKELDES